MVKKTRKNGTRGTEEGEGERRTMPFPSRQQHYMT